MTATPTIKSAGRPRPYQGGLRRTLLGIGPGVATTLLGRRGTADLGRAALRRAPPRRRLSLAGSAARSCFGVGCHGREDSQPGPGTPSGSITIVCPWRHGSSFSTTTTRSSTTWSRSWASSGRLPFVFRNDAIDVEGIRAQQPDALLISPGPGRPEDGGVSLDAIRPAGRRAPDPGRLPRSPVHRPGLRGHGRRGPAPHARQDLGDPPRRVGHLPRATEPLRGHPLPLSRRRPGLGTQGADGDRHLDRRRDHGVAPS